jgi:hypothetical protein
VVLRCHSKTLPGCRRDDEKEGRRFNGPALGIEVEAIATAKRYRIKMLMLKD